MRITAFLRSLLRTDSGLEAVELAITGSFFLLKSCLKQKRVVEFFYYIINTSADWFLEA